MYRLLIIIHTFNKSFENTFFEGKQIKNYLCFEMYLLREQLFKFFDSWLLIIVAAALYFHGN